MDKKQNKQDCIFCKIIAGEIPCYKIYENEDALVFLDAFPSMLGQTLVIPKKHIEPFLFDIKDSDYLELMAVAKRIAVAINKSLEPVKTGMVVEGLEVKHVHIKLFPLSSDGFRNISKLIEPRPSEKEMKVIAEKIKKEI